MSEDHESRSSVVRALSFVVVILGGQVLLLPVVLTFVFARSVTRQPSLIYFCLAWVAFSVFASLLLYGGQLGQHNAPAALCLVQLCGLLGSYILAGFAAICLSIQVYWATPNGDKPHFGQRFEPVLAYIPPVAWLAHQLLFIGIHFLRPNGIEVSAHDQLCVVDKPHKLTRLTQTVAAACACVSICITVFMLVRAVGYLRAQGLSLQRILRRSRRTGSTSVWIRILVRLTVFEIYCILVVLVVVVMSASRPSAIVRQSIDFIIDTVPLVTFLVFGTSLDVLQAWGLYKPGHQPQRSTTTAGSTTFTTFTRKDTLGPPVPAKEDAYALGGLPSPSLHGGDWAPSGPGPLSPVPGIPRARSLKDEDVTLAVHATPSLYREQTRRDPALASAAFTESLPPSAGASIQSFATADPLYPQSAAAPRWQRNWGEPVRRAPEYPLPSPGV